MLDLQANAGPGLFQSAQLIFGIKRAIAQAWRPEQRDHRSQRGGPGGADCGHRSRERRSTQGESANAEREGTAADGFEIQLPGIVRFAGTQPGDFPVILEAVGGYHARRIRVVDDGVRQFAGLGEDATGTNRFVSFGGDLTTELEGLLPGEHGVVSVLSGVPLGQFGGRHEAVSDVVSVAGRWVFNPGDILVSSH